MKLGREEHDAERLWITLTTRSVGTMHDFLNASFQDEMEAERQLHAHIHTRLGTN